MAETFIKYLDRHNKVRLYEGSDGFNFIVKASEDYAYDVYNRLAESHIEGIPEIYSVDRKDGKTFITEEYIAGKNLNDVLNSVGPMTLEAACPVVTGICDIITALQNLNPSIVHRDIKPSNIMISEKGKIYLIDFDAAREFEEGLKSDTIPLGTEKFAAPEQHGYAQSDVRTDIYNLGVTINLMLTGKYPSETVACGAAGIVINKCISIDPKKRYSSAQFLKKDFIRITRGKNPNMGFGSFLKKITLVGFRSKNPFKMTIATLGYIGLFVSCFGLMIFKDSTSGEPLPAIANRIYELWIFLSVLNPIYFYFDYLNLRTSIIKTKNKILNFFLSLLFVLLVFFILTIVAASIGNYLS